MPSCQNCGADLGPSFRFCPMCATPQTDEARRRLNDFSEQRASQRSGSDTAAGDDLRRRIRYAAGFVSVVAGLATLTAGPGVFFLLAGLFVLPPVRRTIESRLGRSVGDRPTAAAAGALVAVGAAALVAV